MALYIQILNGHLKGHQIALTKGLTFGRDQGDVQLKDSKVSNPHAQVDYDESGQLILVDMNSSNALSVGENKVRHLELMRGVEFSIGRVCCRVEDGNPEGLDRKMEPKDWRHRLKHQIESLRIEGQASLEEKIKKFTHPLYLTFIDGPMIEQEFTISYGPRLIGRDSLDIQIHDPEAPSLAFSIQQGDQGIQIINEAKKEESPVFLNSRPFSINTVKNGDLIQVSNSKIRLTFI